MESVVGHGAGEEAAAGVDRAVVEAHAVRRRRIRRTGEAGGELTHREALEWEEYGRDM